MIGHLSFASQVICPGRPYIRKFIDRIRSVFNPAHYVKVTCEIRSDCVMWLFFLDSYNGVSLLRPSEDVSYSHFAFSSDASGWGCAAVLHHEWFQCQWPSPWKLKHINILEFVPIVLALEIWGDRWHHAVLCFHCDNSAVVEVINRLTSRDPHMLFLLRKVMQFSMAHDVIIRAIHCPGKLNTIADSLSRFQPSPDFLDVHGLVNKLRVVPLKFLQSLLQ